MTDPDIQKAPKKFGGDIPVGVNALDPEDRKKIILQIIEERHKSAKKLEEIAQSALADAINRAKSTQQWILYLNIAMFVFGVILIGVAVYVSYSEKNSAYSILFGGVGFLQIVASFFVGSFQRAQKAVSDLVQIEIAYLNYFEQVSLWEIYASVIDENYCIDESKVEKAARQIQICSKETIRLLQKNIEEKEAEKKSLG